MGTDPRLRRIAVAVIGYVVAAWAAGALTLPRDSFVTFRPPNAFLLAAALLDRPDRWWIYALATIPANPTFYRPDRTWLTIIGYSFANFVEVALGAGLIRRVLGRVPRFSALADCAAFILIVAMAASLVSASIGSGVAVLARVRTFWEIWRNWFFADALSYVALTPFMMLAVLGRWRITKERRWEAIGLAVAVVGIAVLAFDGQLGQVSRFPALVYAPFPFLIWVAVRFGPMENAIAVLMLCGIVLTTALSGRGAFGGLSPADSALSMQLLLLMMAVPLMFLAAMVDERRQGEARFTTLFRATPDIIAITRRSDGRVIEVNESFERLGGFTRERAIGRTTVDLGLLSGGDAREALMARLEADGRIRDYPVTTTDADGGVRHALISIEQIELDGEDALITVRRDVTQQVLADAEKARIEVQLQQARKMEAIGQLAGGIAHDFNNLLQAIRGYTEIAADRVAQDHPAQAALHQVTRAADQAATLTTQLLTFSRREALKSQPLDLNAVVGHLIRLLRRLIGEHIELRVEGAPVLPAMQADPNQVEQVVMNLCINARDAMPSGGRVTIRTGARSFSAEECRGRPWAREGEWVWLAVADEGSGIPPDVLPRIFEPFFTTKAVDRGTGLGLATVYAIVERHGGLLSVETAAGAGTTFTIYFPIAGGSAVLAGREAPEVETPEERRGEVILLAEDEPFVRELAVEFLETAGYRVLVACDGAEAEAIVRGSSHVDLALLDVAMPVRTGRQVFDTIQKSRPSLPVVFTSGYSFGELEDIKPVAGSILPKPYSRAVLLKTIRTALEGRRIPTRSVGL